MGSQELPRPKHRTQPKNTTDPRPQISHLLPQPGAPAPSRSEPARIFWVCSYPPVPRYTSVYSPGLIIRPDHVPALFTVSENSEKHTDLAHLSFEFPRPVRLSRCPHFHRHHNQTSHPAAEVRGREPSPTLRCHRTKNQAHGGRYTDGADNGRSLVSPFSFWRLSGLFSWLPSTHQKRQTSRHPQVALNYAPYCVTLRADYSPAGTLRGLQISPITNCSVTSGTDARTN